MAGDRELNLGLRGAGGTTLAPSRWGWGAHKFEPLLVSAVLTLSLHAALIGVPVRTQFATHPVLPGTRPIHARTLQAATTVVPSTEPDSLDGTSAALSSRVESLRQGLNAPKSTPGARVAPLPEPAFASPPTNEIVFRIAGEASDEDFFPRSSLDVGPQPTLPVVIDYPQFAATRGSYVSELSLFIDETGKVIRVRIDGNPLPPAMEDSVRSAFMGTAFSPGIVDGLPVRSKIRIEVVFEEDLSQTPRAATR